MIFLKKFQNLRILSTLIEIASYPILYYLSSKKGTLHIKLCDYGEQIIWRDIFLPWYMTFPQIHLLKQLKFSQNYQTISRVLYTLECPNSNFLTIFCNMTDRNERIFQYFSTKFGLFILKV